MEIIDDEDQKHLISIKCMFVISGRKFKMLGSNEIEQTRCEQLLRNK